MSTPWGQGRIEVKNSREDILKGLAAERALKSIYDDLVAANQVSVAYTNFRLHVKKFKKSCEKVRPSSWGGARAEVMALRSQIRVALAEGRQLQSIYDEMKTECNASRSRLPAWPCS